MYNLVPQLVYGVGTFSGYAMDIISVFWGIEANDWILLKCTLQMALACSTSL